MASASSVPGEGAWVEAPEGLSYQRVHRCGVLVSYRPVPVDANRARLRVLNPDGSEHVCHVPRRPKPMRPLHPEPLSPTEQAVLGLTAQIDRMVVLEVEWANQRRESEIERTIEPAYQRLAPPKPKRPDDQVSRDAEEIVW